MRGRWLGWSLLCAALFLIGGAATLFGFWGKRPGLQLEFVFPRPPLGGFAEIEAKREELKELWAAPDRDLAAVQKLQQEINADLALLSQRMGSRGFSRRRFALFGMISWRVQESPPVPFTNTVDVRTGYTHSPDVWTRTVKVQFFPPAIPWFAGLVCALLAGAFIVFRLYPQRPPGHCRRCNYDLRGSPASVCPECGASTARVVVSS